VRAFEWRDTSDTSDTSDHWTTGPLDQRVLHSTRTPPRESEGRGVVGAIDDDTDTDAV
jgi:hypothetical protein